MDAALDEPPPPRHNNNAADENNDSDEGSRSAYHNRLLLMLSLHFVNTFFQNFIRDSFPYPGASLKFSCIRIKINAIPFLGR